jgi:hypothetical protein
MESISDEHKLAVALFNKTWELIGKPDRSAEDDLAMIHIAHASAHHWLNASEVTPQNRSVGEWQCAHVYSILGMGESALYHAKNSLRIAESGDLEDWALASAHEGMARAAAAAGDKDLFAHHFAEATRLAGQIIDPEDRDHIQNDLASEPWFGMKD